MVYKVLTYVYFCVMNDLQPCRYSNRCSLLAVVLMLSLLWLHIITHSFLHPILLLSLCISQGASGILGWLWNLRVMSVFPFEPKWKKIPENCSKTNLTFRRLYSVELISFYWILKNWVPFLLSKKVRKNVVSGDQWSVFVVATQVIHFVGRSFMHGSMSKITCQTHSFITSFHDERR